MLGKMKNKTMAILVTLLVLCLLLSVKLYLENRRLITALHLSSELIDNTSAAYTELGECASKPDNCDYTVSVQKLESLNQQKETIKSQLDAVLSR